MLRRVLNTIIESTINPQYETAFYPNPFTQQDINHLSWLSSLAPCFPVKAENISILTEPQQFYNTLLEKCAEARRRIMLVSLYIGSGVLEQNLVSAILNNSNFISGDLKVNVLLDYTRGSRFTNNSRTVLMPLLRKNNLNCHVSLYHTPVLRGLRKKLAPNRWNELFGLQHMKLYIFDNTLIISGANLSSDYFTNRQDRYFMIKDKNLCDFYCGLVSKVQSFSLKLNQDDHIELETGWTQLPYEGNKNEFVEKAGDLVENYLLDAKDDQNSHIKEGFDTWVFPLVQMGQLGIDQDAVVTDRILADAPEGTRLHIATGYFNLTNQYMRTIIYNSQAKCTLLMAHPNANGFKGAKGMAGGIPDAYSLIAQTFQQKIEKLGQSERISLQEYLRKGWTYHAKGLWYRCINRFHLFITELNSCRYYLPDSRYPCSTLIGSPNFGERSVKRDLETQVAIVTENSELRKRMHDECHRLYEMSLPVESRIIPTWVYGMVSFFRGYF